MAYRKEAFRLRFFDLPEPTADQLRAVLPGSELRRRVSSVLVLELLPTTNLDALLTTLGRLNLGPERFEVIASVVTASDNGGIELPSGVLQLIRQTRCAVSFSFVDIGPEEDPDTELAAPVEGPDRLA